MTTAEFPLVVFDDAARKRFTPRNIPNLALWLDASQGPKTGGAAQFTAANSESLSIADNASLDFSASDLTIVLTWKHKGTPSTGEYIMGQWGSAGARAFQCYWGSSSSISAEVSGNGTSFGTATKSSITPTDWNFLVIQYNKATGGITLAVNQGTPATASTGSGGVFNSASALRMGINSGGGSFADAYGAQWGIWGRLLTTAELDWFFNSGALNRTYEEFGNASNDGANLLTNLVSYWKLGEVSGTRNDSHGTNHLTDNNTVTWAAGPSLIDAYEGSVVRQWNDRSGNGKDFSQATAANMPTFKVGIVNGRPVLRLDGSDDSLSLASAIATGDVTVFVVCKSDGALGSEQAIFSIGSSSSATPLKANMRFATTSGTYKAYHRTDANVLSSSEVLTDWTGAFRIFRLRHESTQQVIAVNVTNTDTDTFDAGALTLDKTSVGQVAFGGTRLDGDVAEVVVYGRALTTPEISKVERYLNRKYNLGLAA